MSGTPIDFQVRKRLVRGRDGRVKNWVIVEVGGTEWCPSFQQLYWIVKLICECEEEKYRSGNALGRNMVKDFLSDACERGIRWSELAERYRLRNEHLEAVRAT